MARRKVVILGAFDPLCADHLSLFQRARSYGNIELWLRSDTWLTTKKGFFLHSFHERKSLLEAAPFKIRVLPLSDSPSAVTTALRRSRPDFFFSLIPQELSEKDRHTCAALGVEVLDELSELAASIAPANSTGRVPTRWGYYDILADFPELKVKRLHIHAGKSLSLQKHSHRTEFFFMPNGEIRVNTPGTWHVLRASKKKDLTVIEVQIGKAEESDIARVSEMDPSFVAEVARRIDLNK